MQHIILRYMEITNENRARDAQHLKNTAKISGNTIKYCIKL